MRYLIIGFLFSVTSSFGQPGPLQLSSIEAEKLFNPQPQPNNDAYDTTMFRHTLVILPDVYAILINNKEQILGDSSELKAFIALNSATIQRQRFFIFYSNVSLEKIVSVIRIVKSAHIENYRVIDFEKYFVPEEPVQVQMPESKSDSIIIDPSAPDFLNIEVSCKRFTVSFNNQKAIFKNDLALNKFIQSNLTLIDKNKIAITVSGDCIEQAKAAIKVLEENDFSRFRLISK